MKKETFFRILVTIGFMLYIIFSFPLLITKLLTSISKPISDILAILTIFLMAAIAICILPINAFDAYLESHKKV